VVGDEERDGDRERKQGRRSERQARAQAQLLLLTEHVPDPAHRLDQPRLTAGFQLAPERADEDVE
jgi:hypothetical protein